MAIEKLAKLNIPKLLAQAAAGDPSAIGLLFFAGIIIAGEGLSQISKNS